MTAERFQQIRGLFDAALSQPEAEREAWLSEACQHDSTLEAEVSELLRQHTKRSGVLDAPAASVNLANLAGAEHLQGHRLGAWELIRVLGRGGMGVVYLVHRADGAFQMHAAMKILNAPFAGEEVRQRFRQEREILAQLSHPNIARLLDGGATDDGLPYLVMEYVDGKPITDWCDERRASIGERLALLETLCGVVHYLHSNNVIHRDLKPANVLVDENGTLKLLDFGISKLLSPVGGQTLLATRSGLHLLTPEYASPEQVLAGPITPQTDVYGLGVMTYELLAGQRPYQVRNRAIHAIMHAICEQEPERPSTVVTHGSNGTDSDGVQAGTVGRLRNTSPQQLSQRLRELDGVVLKALQKEPALRYRSVQDLALDLSAQREGRQVSAQKDSPLKRLLLTLNKQRVPLVLGVAAISLLLSGAVTIHSQAILLSVVASLVLVFCYLFADPDLRAQWVKDSSTWNGRATLIAVLLGTVIFGSAFTFNFFLTLPRHSAQSTLTAMGALLLLFQVSLMTYWFMRTRWAGKLLVNASANSLRWYPWLMGGLFLLMLGTYIEAMAHGVTLSLYQKLQIVYLGLVALSSRLWLGTQEFRQKGIIIRQGIFRWDRIRSWRWETKGPTEATAQADGHAYEGLVEASRFRNNAVLRLELRVGQRNKAPLRLAVLPAKVAEVSNVLERYLGNEPQQTAIESGAANDSASDARAKKRLRQLVLALLALEAIGIFTVLRAQQIDRFLAGSKSTNPVNIVLRNPADDLEYIWIPAGSFTMGCSPGDDRCEPQEKPAHEVTLTHGFWIGKTEVTWAAINRKGWQHTYVRPRRPNGPSALVNWYEAQAYCEDTHMRLPTEAEWEYAARAGTADATYGLPEEVAQRQDGEIPPNPWGLSQVLGNEREWVADRFGAYWDLSVQDPHGPFQGENRVMRGWSDRVSWRQGHPASAQVGVAGFRCAGELRQ